MQQENLKLTLAGFRADGECRLVTGEINEPRGMVWDGDGTIFVVDWLKGLYSIPSGNIEQHQVTEVIPWAGLVGLDLFEVGDIEDPNNPVHSGASTAGPMLPLLLAALAVSWVHMHNAWHCVEWRPTCLFV